MHPGRRGSVRPACDKGQQKGPYTHWTARRRLGTNVKQSGAGLGLPVMGPARCSCLYLGVATLGQTRKLCWSMPPKASPKGSLLPLSSGGAMAPGSVITCLPTARRSCAGCIWKALGQPSCPAFSGRQCRHRPSALNSPSGTDGPKGSSLQWMITPAGS